MHTLMLGSGRPHVEAQLHVDAAGVHVRLAARTNLLQLLLHGDVLRVIHRQLLVACAEPDAIFNSLLSSRGVHLSGQHYLYIRGDKRSIYASRGDDGSACIIRMTEAVIVGIFKRATFLANCAALAQNARTLCSAPTAVCWHKWPGGDWHPFSVDSGKGRAWHASITAREAFWVAVSEADARCIHEVLRRPACPRDVAIHPMTGMTALFHLPQDAAPAALEDVIAAVLTTGVHIDEPHDPCRDHTPALGYAIVKNNAAAVRALVGSRASLDVTVSKRGRSLLEAARFYADEAMVVLVSHLLFEQKSRLKSARVKPGGLVDMLRQQHIEEAAASGERTANGDASAGVWDQEEWDDEDDTLPLA